MSYARAITCDYHGHGPFMQALLEKAVRSLPADILYAALVAAGATPWHPYYTATWQEMNRRASARFNAGALED